MLRLFSCGTSKEGESHIVEWNESEGAVKRIYQGFRKRSLGVVQFDTAKNRFLAAGDDFSIKIWDMDNTQLLQCIDTDGGLPVSFNYNILTSTHARALTTYFMQKILHIEPQFFFFTNVRQVLESASTRMGHC